MRIAPKFSHILITVLTLAIAAIIAGCSINAVPPGPEETGSTEENTATLAGHALSTSVSPRPGKVDFSLIPPVRVLAAPLASSGATEMEQPDAVLLPPSLLETEPPDGASWDGGPVLFRFDQPLTTDSANALTIEPDLDGTTSVSGNALTFSPNAAPLAGTRYRFTLGEGVTSVAGSSLAAPVAITLSAAVPLQVTSTQPIDGMEEVAPDGQIVIAFNRPVVPLVGVDQQMDLPQPLTIVPAAPLASSGATKPVRGSGRWLNTSVYAFSPDAGFAGSTRYDVTVSDITGLGGEVMNEAYSFSFVTAAPIVVRSSPSGTAVRPDSAVTVTFSQPMDPFSTEGAFRLLRLNQNAPPTSVDGEITWNDTGTVLTFVPAADLGFGDLYQIEVTTDAQSASRQGHQREIYHRDFAVVPLPAIKSTAPIDGTDGVAPDTNVIISFNTAVSPTLVAEQVSVTPMLSTTQVFSYYSYYNNRLQLSWLKEPGTQYTVTVGGKIADEYGNTLGEDYLFSFTTGDYSPFIRLETDRFSHFSAYTDTRVSLLYRNVDQLNVELFSVPDHELFKLTGEDQWNLWNGYQIPERDVNRIWQRTYLVAPLLASGAAETGEEKNVTIRQIITLTDTAGEVLPPGAYLLEVAPPPEKDGTFDLAKRSQALIFLSNYNLVLKRSQQGPSLAWLTDLRTGQPIAGANIGFFAAGTPIGDGITDTDGIVDITLNIDEEKQWAPILAISGRPGDSSYAVVSSEWHSGIATWDFGLSGGWGADPLTAYFYTDRPIYRPGQTVYWKGIIRELTDDQYRLPPNHLPVYVEIRDDLGNVIFKDEQVRLNEHGTLHGVLDLSPEAIAGYYYLEARVPTGEGQYSYQGTSFQVASYRKPEFEISLSSEQPEYVQGDTVLVTARASYFSGGPLADAAVSWRIISQPYFFAWANAPENRAYSFTPFDPDQESYDPYSGSLALGMIREGTGRTNDSGEFFIDVPADLGQALQSQRWLIDVTVRSPTNQFVSGSVSLPIHAAGIYVGLSTASYVSRVSEETAIDIVAVTPEGVPFPAAEIDVTVYEFEWNSVYERSADGTYRWETSVNRTAVFSTTTTSDRQGSARVPWTPSKGGQYQVAAVTRDDAGYSTSSSMFLWASSRDPSQFVAWPRENNDRLDLVTDKKQYAPGDIARLLVPSPFSGPVQALLTIERGGVLESQLLTLAGNSETLEIPITSKHIPNIYVGIFIVKGVDETNPSPAMRVGYVQLAVDTTEKELVVRADLEAPLLAGGADSSAQQVKPGTTVTYTVVVLDQSQTPVPQAEVSVAVIDKAILSLAPEAQRSMVDVFYYQRPLDVTTGALLTINRDRKSLQLSEGAKGGGGGGGGGGPEIRQEFPDSAFWRADFVTDEQGMIQFAVSLPDNLTTWRLVAKAVTGDTKVGETTDDILATKDLQIRTLAPRFFTSGDRATLGAVIMNTTRQPLSDGGLTLKIDGAHVEGSMPSDISFQLEAGEHLLHTWPIAVDPDAEEVIVTLSAIASSNSQETLDDAVQISLPVRRYESPETVATAGTVPPEGALEVIYLPQAATDSGELLVAVEPSLASSMIGGLNYLQHYPYECNEQTVSRFLPNLFAVRALRKLDIENADLETDLAYQLGIGVQRLLSRQNQDGGWGYWPGEDSSAFITSYVLWGLASAEEMGYAIPSSALQNAVAYLDRQFQAPNEVNSTWQLNEMAFVHFVLSEMGEGDPGRANTLYDVRERLGLYGKALLAMALANMAESPNLPVQSATLLGDLIGAAELTATTAWWQEGSVDYFTLNTDTRTTSMVLSAFSRLEPSQPLLPLTVRWLTEIRKADRWSTTQENAWALVALTDWLEVSEELKGDYDWQVELNGDLLGKGSVDSSNLDERTELRAEVADLLRGEANSLALSRSSDRGQLYYTTHLRYFLDALAIDARDRGIVVDRRLSLRSQGQDQTTSAAVVGDVISVTVTIVAPTDLHQLLVEVPIPAGTEPIDPNLLTTSNQYDYPEFGPVSDDERGWWYRWRPTHTDMRDDKVALFASYLPAGAYEYTFNVRASIPGEYRLLPAYAEQMYFNEVWGRSAGALFTVRE